MRGSCFQNTVLHRTTMLCDPCGGSFCYEKTQKFSDLKSQAGLIVTCVLALFHVFISMLMTKKLISRRSGILGYCKGKIPLIWLSHCTRLKFKMCSGRVVMP